MDVKYRYFIMKIEIFLIYKDKKLKKKLNNLYSYFRYYCMYCL